MRLAGHAANKSKGRVCSNSQNEFSKHRWAVSYWIRNCMNKGNTKPCEKNGRGKIFCFDKTFFFLLKNDGDSHFYSRFSIRFLRISIRHCFDKFFNATFLRQFLSPLPPFPSFSVPLRPLPLPPQSFPLLWLGNEQPDIRKALAFLSDSFFKSNFHKITKIGATWWIMSEKLRHADVNPRPSTCRAKALPLSSCARFCWTLFLT